MTNQNAAPEAVAWRFRHLATQPDWKLRNSPVPPQFADPQQWAIEPLYLDPAGTIAALTDRNRALTEALEHIGEYWNGNANERAMLDALEHIGAVCTAALHPTQPKEQNDG